MDISEAALERMASEPEEGIDGRLLRLSTTLQLTEMPLLRDEQEKLAYRKELRDEFNTRMHMEHWDG